MNAGTHFAINAGGMIFVVWTHKIVVGVERMLR